MIGECVGVHQGGVGGAAKSGKETPGRGEKGLFIRSEI